MRKFWSRNGLIVILSLVYLSIFALTYPSTFLTTDEIQYFDQGYCYAGGSSTKTFNDISGNSYTVLPGQFPVGTPALLALTITFFGNQQVFWIGAVLLCFAFVLTAKSLDNAGFPTQYAGLIFLFLPAVISARTVMSDVPSLCMISGFLYLHFRGYRTHFEGIVGGLLAGLSVLFRETNIVICAPFLIWYVAGRGRYRNALLLGAFLGIGIRMVAAKIAFGDFFFFKDPGYGFGFRNVPENALLYALILMTLVPVGLYTMIKYKGKYSREILTAASCFVGLHIFYGYNGLDTSGLKGLFLGPRFMIPLLPLFALTTAEFVEGIDNEKSRRYLRNGIIVGAVMSVSIVNVVGLLYNREQEKITNAIRQAPGDRMAMGSPELRKFVNMLNGGDPLLLGRIPLCNSTGAPQESVAVFDILRKETDSRIVQARGRMDRLSKLLASCPLDTLQSVTIIDGTTLVGYMIKQEQNPNRDE